MKALVEILGYSLLLGVVVPVALRWADAQRRPDAAREGPEATLSFPLGHVLVLSVTLAPFALLLLHALAFEREALPKVGQVCAIFLAPGLIADWYIATFRIVLGDAAITKRSLGGRVQIAWSDLESVRWHPSLGVMRLSSADGRSTITVWPTLHGLRTLATRLRQRKLQMDEATRGQLDSWEQAQPSRGG